MKNEQVRNMARKNTTYADAKTLLYDAKELDDVITLEVNYVKLGIIESRDLTFENLDTLVIARKAIRIDISDMYMCTLKSTNIDDGSEYTWTYDNGTVF